MGTRIEDSRAEDESLEERARAIEALARSAGTAVVYAPSFTDASPGWSEVGLEVGSELDRHARAPLTRRAI